MRLAPWLRWLACGLLAWAVVRTAWMCDDAYITLRTVDNFVQGHGLRWNVLERVQTYTHPLWMFLLSGVYALTGAAYFGTLALSALCTAAAVGMLAFGVARTAVVGAVAVVVLACSRAFVDYATSGLENPLANLLLVGFAWVHLRPRPGRDPLAGMALLAALLLTTRMDLLLLVLPALVVRWWGRGPGAGTRTVLAGMLPFVLWCLFAMVYYGSVFPVTAHAKAIDTGIPRATVLVQGLDYFANLARRDPVTLAVLVAGLVAGAGRRGPARPLAVGMLLYLGYVLWVGGDFMEGRFFVAPFVVAMVVLAERVVRPGTGPALLVAAAALVLSVPGPIPPWLSGPDYGNPADDEITDERAFYYPDLGLLAPERRIPRPRLHTAKLSGVSVDEPIFVFELKVGVYGFGAGPKVHVVDRILCDPFCARLPAHDPTWFRPGHNLKRLPEGYLESLASGANHLHHPGLRPLWDDLRRAVRAPLFDGERWSALWRLWTGRHRRGVEDFVREEYRDPPLVAVAAGDLDEPVPPGTPWWRGPLQVIAAGGVEVRFPRPRAERRVALGLDSGDRYRLVFVQNGRAVGEVGVRTPGRFLSALQPLEVDVPGAVPSFDALRLLPVERQDEVAAVGYVR